MFFIWYANELCTISKVGYISKNYHGKRVNSEVSPVRFGPTAIGYDRWKKDRGY